MALSSNPGSEPVARAGDDSDFSGWLLKDAPRGGDQDKRRSALRRLRAGFVHQLLPPGAAFKLRFFVLRGMDLEYYRDAGRGRLVSHGVIDLNTISEARAVDPAVRPSAPPMALELVTESESSVVTRRRGLQYCQCSY